MVVATGTALLAAAAATAGSAALSSSAAKKAAGTAQQVATDNRQLEADQFAKAEGLLRPTIARGDVAGDRLGALLGLGGDAGAANDAFDKYLESTGYQFTADRGIDAINSRRATSGLLNSGATIKAATQFGQDNAQQYFKNYLGDLSSVAGMGANAGSALASRGAQYAQNVGAQNTAAGNTSALAGLAGANAWGGALSNVADILGNKSAATASSYQPFEKPNFGVSI